MVGNMVGNIKVIDIDKITEQPKIDIDKIIEQLKIIKQYKEENKSIKLNIACGQTRNPNINGVVQEGFIGIDKIKTDQVDIVHDLESYPWPFENDSIDEIYCSHYIEHTSDLIKFMEELYRIMKPESKAIIIAPWYASIRAWQDPTHKRAISDATFLYFRKEWREQTKLDHYDIKANFDFIPGYILSPEWINRSEEARTFAMTYYWNVIQDIMVTLTKK